MLSLNRFERKKHIGLAIEACARRLRADPKVRLVLAGGYDRRLPENVGHALELEALAAHLGRPAHLLRPAEVGPELVGRRRDLRLLDERPRRGLLPADGSAL